MQACKKVHLASGVINNVHGRKDIANLKAHLETKDELILNLQVIQTFPFVLLLVENSSTHFRITRIAGHMMLTSMHEDKAYHLGKDLQGNFNMNKAKKVKSGCLCTGGTTYATPHT